VDLKRCYRNIRNEGMHEIRFKSCPPYTIIMLNTYRCLPMKLSFCSYPDWNWWMISKGNIKRTSMMSCQLRRFLPTWVTRDVKLRFSVPICNENWADETVLVGISVLILICIFLIHICIVLILICVVFILICIVFIVICIVLILICIFLLFYLPCILNLLQPCMILIG